MLKKFREEISQGLTPTTWWKHEDFATAKDASIELKNLFDGKAAFATPKPTRLVERILQIATLPGDLVMDSFAGSGTTGHAVIKLNHSHPDEAPRRFILAEINPKIARDITGERVRRVAQGYTNTKGDKIPGEDMLHIVLIDEPVSSALEPMPGFHFCYDMQGWVVGFDVEEASERIDDPRTIEVSFGE